MSESGFTDIRKDRSRMDNQAGKIITSLKTVLSDNSIPEQAKKIFVLQWFDIYRGKENELVSVLLSEKLSDTVFDLLDRTALRNLIMRLAGQVYSPEAGTDAIRFIGWLVQHIETVAVLVSRPVKDVWHSLFLSLASWDVRTVSTSVNDAVVQLLSAVTGNDSNNIKTALDSLISRLLRVPDTAAADNERTYHDSNKIRTLPDLEDNFLLSLLVRTWRYIRSEDRTSEWPASDVLYGNPTNTDTALHRIPEDDNPQGYAYPMISIYILGHKVGDLKEPVIYVRRHYLDEKSNIITEGVPDPFIESLTHDTIIVQIPYLNGRTRTRLERLLNVFDQDYRLKENGHFLEFDEEKLEGAEEQLVVDRLIRAAVAPKVRRSMQVEDEILSEIERRDTEIMLREAKIEQQNQEIEKNRQALEQNKQELEQNKQELEQNKQELEQNKQELEQNKQELKQNRQELEQNRQELEQSKQLVCSMVSLLQASGLSVGEIAGRLNLDEHEVGKMLGNR